MGTLTDGTTLEALRENFQVLEDWEDRFSYLIDLGRKIPPMADEEKTEANRVHGCQATVYLRATLDDRVPPRLRLRATSDAHIVSGLIAVLLLMYDDLPPTAILRADVPGLLKELDLEAHLSPTRRNGLHAMIQRIRALAAEHAAPGGAA